MFKKLIVLSMVVSLSACVSMMTFTAGNKVDRTHIDDIKIGVQDKEQIKAWFGKPYAEVKFDSINAYGCVERLTFEYAKSKGGKLLYSEILVVDFDKNGKVCDKAFNEKGLDK